MPIPQLAMQAAGAAINTGLGLALEGHNDRRQLRQNKRLGEQQLGFDLQRLDAQSKAQYEMWLKTNYPGQLEQMKKAGLSPGLMYGMSGGGGTTTGGGIPSGSGGQAPQGGNEIIGLQLMKAQKDLLEAQATKTGAEAEKIQGVDTEKAKTEIESLTQGIQNQKATERLSRIQGNIAEIEEDLTTRS